jgi:hypothetical protein
MNRRWITYLFVLGLTGLVAACGGEDDDDNGDDNGEDNGSIHQPADDIRFV